MSTFHKLPKVLLHDHLDGGIRPETAVELSRSQNIPLPDGIKTADEIARWFRITPEMSMEDVFRRFDLPIALMKSRKGIGQVMEDAIADYRADNIIYAEPRFAPQQHVGPLSLDEVIDAATEAFTLSGLAGGLILCAMRQRRETAELVNAAIRWRGHGVAGVDLAGPEPGEPLAPHRGAFWRARKAGLGVTLHAGEMIGPRAIAEVLEAGFDARIGHGVWIIRDCTVEEGRIVDLGPIARALRDAGSLLEACVSSNRAVGIRVEDHPISMLREAGFRISVNTDNRIGKDQALTKEYRLLADKHGFGSADFQSMNKDALASAFTGEETRVGLMEQFQAKPDD